MIGVIKKQSLKLIGTISIIIVIFGLHSCEYESDNINFINLEKPEEESQFRIDLAGVNPEEIIFVDNNSAFFYSIFTDERDILHRQFYWDGEPIETNENTGYVFIHVEEIDDNIHELKLVIAYKTGTESLAEHAGLEMYVGEYNFKVKVLDITRNSNDDFNLREGIDKNGNLKIEWDKPTEYDVEGYNVYHGDKHWGTLLATIYDPDETFFVDTEYTYGYKNITVEAVVKNSFYLSTFDEINISYTTITKEQFEVERHSKYEFLVRWENPNPFPCKYVLTNDMNNDIIVSENDGEWVNIPARQFPTFSDQFYIYLMPKDADTNNYESYPSIIASFSDKKLSYVDITANKSEGLIHTLNFNSVDTYDVNTMKKVFSAKQSKSINTGSKIHTSEDGKIAYGDRDVYIFSDYKPEYELSAFSSYNDSYNFIGNDKVITTKYNGFDIYDIKTKTLLASKYWGSDDGEIMPYVNISVSKRGNYIYVQYTENDYLANKDWLEVYELTADNKLLLLSKREFGKKTTLLFNPNNEDEVIVQYPIYESNKFIIGNIKTNNWKEFKGEFMTIDPFNGNILYKEDKYKIYIMNKDYVKEDMTIEMDFNTNNKPILVNDILFVHSSYTHISNLK